MNYKRVLIKVSGEALSGGKGTGFDFDFIIKVCNVIKECVENGVQVGIVTGGGNFWRGVKDGAGHVERVSADRIGMLATCMNCMAVADVFRQLGMKAEVFTAFEVSVVGKYYRTAEAIDFMEKGGVALFAGGTGAPFFSTDTAATLRAAEIQADAILLAKNIDGVYSADPRKDPSAVKYDEISYAEVLEKRLAVMDSTATSMAMDNNMPLIVFALENPENIKKVLSGEKIGTLVK